MLKFAEYFILEILPFKVEHLVVLVARFSAVIPAPYAFPKGERVVTFLIFQ